MLKNPKMIISTVAVALFVVVGGFFLVAKSLNDSQSGMATQNRNSASKSAQKDITDSGEKLPEPTGKVDDTVDAIIEESNLETNLVSGADDVARDATNDTQEADELANSYDENEF